MSREEWAASGSPRGLSREVGGVKKIVTMSGLPAAAPGDTVANWLVYTKSWPDEMPELDRYQ